MATYHKIPKVDKSICTKEQKIAYGLAWSLNVQCNIISGYAKWKEKGNHPDEYVNAVIKKADYFLHTCTEYTQYPVVEKIFKNGIKNYLENQWGILFGYDTIGKIFPIVEN